MTQITHPLELLLYVWALISAVVGTSLLVLSTWTLVFCARIRDLLVAKIEYHRAETERIRSGR